MQPKHQWTTIWEGRAASKNMYQAEVLKHVISVQYPCQNCIYSLRPILLFTNTDVSRHILVIDTSVLAKSNMGRREYIITTSLNWTHASNGNTADLDEQGRCYSHSENTTYCQTEAYISFFVANWSIYLLTWHSTLTGNFDLSNMDTISTRTRSPPKVSCAYLSLSSTPTVS
jgi:hypothetical protein